jgi:hypothetical protein
MREEHRQAGACATAVKTWLPCSGASSSGLVLAVLLAAGCGQAEGTVLESVPAASDTMETSAPLRIGRRAPRVSPAVRQSLGKAAARLSDLQADAIGDNARNGLDDTDPDDGGWDFTLATTATAHGTAASPANTYGVTALGPWAAVRAGNAQARYQTTLLGAGLGMQPRTDVHSPNDFVFLPLLAELADDAGFDALAKARYDARVGGNGGATAVAEKDRDARHASGFDGLILYDLAWWTLGAASLDAAFPGQGYDADADAFAAVAMAALTSSPPLFDVDDATERFYTQGLAWSLVVLERAGDPTALADKVRAHLRDGQASDGAWGWNAGSPADDLQSTAHVVQALSLTTGNGARGRAEADRGAAWILGQQAANGGWAFAAGQESTEVDAEAMLALYLAAVRHPEGALDPAPASDIGQASSALTLVPAVPGSPPPLASPSE